MQLKILASSSRLINYGVFRVNTTINSNNLRFKSSKSSNDLILVNVNDKTGFSLVTLNSPPVNSLNLELLSTFSKTLDELKANNARGMILTSVSRFLELLSLKNDYIP